MSKSGLKRLPYDKAKYVRVPYTEIYWDVEKLEELAKDNPDVRDCRVDTKATLSTPENFFDSYTNDRNDV